MMTRRKKLSVFWCAVGGGVVMGFVGLAAGILYSVGGFLYELLTWNLNRGTLLAFGAIIGMPVVFVPFGVVAGALLALAVNSLTTRVVSQH